MTHTKPIKVIFLFTFLCLLSCDKPSEKEPVSKQEIEIKPIDINMKVDVDIEVKAEVKAEIKKEEK